MDEVTLRLGATLFGGWTEARVSRSLEAAAGTFDLTVSERWPGQPDRWEVRPGAACVVQVGKEVLIKGWVDEVRRTLAADSHAVQVTGRDATGDLVDCTAMGTGQWSNAELAEIAGEMARPFGVPITCALGHRLAEFTVQQGETVLDALGRAARLTGLMCWPATAGGLTLGRPGAALLKGALEEGKNLLHIEATTDMRDRFSEYHSVGEAAAWESGAVPVARSATARDSGVGRHRPLLVRPEQGGDMAAHTGHAEWERRVRLARSVRVSARVAGWRHQGTLWAPGQSIKVAAPTVHINATLLVTSVAFSLDGQGTLTALEMTLPDAYLEAP